MEIERITAMIVDELKKQPRAEGRKTYKNDETSCSRIGSGSAKRRRGRTCDGSPPPLTRK
jgi:hypothetical protein